MRQQTEQDSLLSMPATKRKLIDVVRYCREKSHTHTHTHPTCFSSHTHAGCSVFTLSVCVCCYEVWEHGVDLDWLRVSVKSWHRRQRRVHLSQRDVFQSRTLHCVWPAKSPSTKSDLSPFYSHTWRLNHTECHWHFVKDIKRKIRKNWVPDLWEISELCGYIFRCVRGTTQRILLKSLHKFSHLIPHLRSQTLQLWLS